MRIAYCIHSLHNSGGIERILTAKANYLADRMGYEVWIVTARMHGRTPCFPLCPRVRTVDLGVNDRLPFGQKHFLHKLDACLKEIKPDIAISTGGSELYVLPDCTDGSVKIAEYHFPYDKFLYKYGNNAFSRYRTRKVEKAAVRFQAFVVLTRQDKGKWVVPQIRQIYNPLTFSCPESAPLEAPACMAVGRLKREKNFTDLVDAWSLVARRHPDWTLDIYGEGKEREKLEKQVQSLGLEKQVCLRGLSTKIREEYLKHSCLIVSSKYEGLSMVLLEAAECGLPMVSYDCPTGPAEIIDDRVNGRLVVPGDKVALADAICEVIESDRKPMGLAAKETAARFSADTIMKEWDSLFRSLL